MINKLILFPIISLILTISNAMADQAQLLTFTEKNKAMSILKGVSKLKAYCEPCGSLTPTIIDVKNLEVEKSSVEGMWVIKVNQKEIDLAYIYYKDNSLWKNLAISLNIEVSSVSEILENDNTLELTEIESAIKLLSNKSNYQLWLWTKNNKTMSFSIKIVEINGVYWGEYCAISQAGNKIDCSSKAELPFKFTDSKPEFEFITHYGRKKGKAKLTKSDGNWIWQVTDSPSSTFYGPKLAILKPNKKIN